MYDTKKQSLAERLNGKLSSFIVPCFNEADALPTFYGQWCAAMSEMGSPECELVFVDDGSVDKTLEVVKSLAEKDSRVRFVSFSRNFGKEAAMLAGLRAASGCYVAIMDADTQDPPSLLPQMYNTLLESGADCVAARRSDRVGESKIRSFLARLYYKIINRFSTVKLVEGARDYRLMTRRVADAILSLPENTRFIKGIYEWVGFKTEWVSYPNVPRSAGDSKWSLPRLVLYGFDGITAFSAVPLAIASFTGFVFCVLSVFAIIFIIIRQLLFHNSAYGWPSMMCVIIFLGGLQLVCLGMIGQYLSKLYIEAKKRPMYIVKEKSD